MINSIASLRTHPFRPSNGAVVLVEYGAAPGDGIGGWFRFDSGSAAADDGATAIAVNDGIPGRWLKIGVAGGSGARIKATLLTAAARNITVSPATKTIFLRGCAGGGGGGGISTAATAGGGGGGGSSGSRVERTIAVTPNTAYAYTCGGGGAGGAAGVTGTIGANSTFVVGATTITCNGGLGGVGAAAVAGTSINVGGASPAVSANGDVNGCGVPGSSGIGLAANLACSGQGGDGLFGGGGAARNTQGAGINATAYGSGGGGACLLSAGASVVGGNGTPGCWVVDEYT
ncbi:MAG: hypothetical protein WC563_15415 [Brevundimonas sp.]